MDSRMDDVVLGCCVVCEKKCFKKVDNWRGLSPEWASQLNIDYEKAHAAAGAGFKGMARLCYNCRTKKTKKPADSGKNGRKGQGKGKAHKRKCADVEEVFVSSDLPVFVTCGVCKQSAEPDDFRRWYPCYSRAVDFDGFLEMACKGCTSAARKKYRYSGGRAATNSPLKTRQMKPSDFLAQIRELQAQMELLREEVRHATSAKALYQKALGFANANKKISELGDMRSKRTR